MTESTPIHPETGTHAVLLLHGLSSSPLEMRYLARALQRNGFTAVAPVLTGYSAGTREQRMEAWIAAAVQEFDVLSSRYARVSVCGLSIGAALALAVVNQRPSAQSMVLLSVTLDYNGWAIPWYQFLLGWAYFTPLRSRWRYHEQAPFGLRNEALRSKVARAMLKGGLSEVGPATISLPALHEASRLARNVRSMLPAMNTDCLIVHAIDDETSSPANARFIGANLAGTFIRTIYLDDSYHMITSDNERETVVREVVTFLRESEAASAARSGNDAGKTPVVSKALARRLRQIAALAK